MVGLSWLASELNLGRDSFSTRPFRSFPNMIALSFPFNVMAKDNLLNLHLP